MRVQSKFLKSFKALLSLKPINNYGQFLNVYSLDPFPEPFTSFEAKNLTVQRIEKPFEKPIFNEKLIFGKTHTDHMFEVDWDIHGWKTPNIVPFQNFQINPFNTTLHYAICCFEGMKAYKDDKGRVRLFRPQLNIIRLRRSSLRTGLPDFNGKEFLKCLREYVKLEKDWIPQKKGYSLYLRPTAISMTDVLGVRMADHSKLYVVSSPVGPYYPSGFKPIKIWCEGRMVRASPKGVGNFKLGSNYGPTVPISKLAEIKGYNQILWLYDDLITEVGTSNVFIYWKNEEGEDELITPPSDNLILHGIIRDSVLNLAAEMDRFKVTEKKISILEVIKALKEKRVYEMFTSGTAVIVGPIETFHYKDTEYSVPIDPKINSGRLAKELNEKLQNIMYGNVEHPWSMVCD